jgi:uncharacterized membrane protein
MRDWLLILHILGAAAWLGGGLHSWYAYNQLVRKPEISEGSLTTLSKSADRFFGPAAVLTLLTGVILVLTQDPWGWSDGFVIVGLGVFLFSAISQPLAAAKVEERLLAAAAGEGDMRSALGRFNRTALVDVGVVVVALWAMVVKFGA